MHACPFVQLQSEGEVNVSQFYINTFFGGIVFSSWTPLIWGPYIHVSHFRNFVIIDVIRSYRAFQRC